MQWPSSSTTYYEMQAACPKEFFSGLSFYDIIESSRKRKPLRLRLHMWQGPARTLRHFCSLHKDTMTRWCESASCLLAVIQLSALMLQHHGSPGGRTQGSIGMLTLAGLTVAQEGGSCCWRMRLGSLAASGPWMGGVEGEAERLVTPIESECSPFMSPTRELRPVATSELHPAKTTRFCGYQESN
ncbi:hypothetical protein HaLaN_31361 [Haematococcus lacustris]|uniref:Uncharacterized protein n=1 Tax=Haematococcus lacustris TaxID=44745 RepID=A0A6A0AHQ0_HAELA|nr:hypothetical protein HaLaN_31361 [Haematococcus lacustris]